ncbi:MAG: MerR family transcriptional regulator [Actinobacteria bacterium]|nr:MerR family transcriptional regulator [Actinomycetota bacterium]
MFVQGWAALSRVIRREEAAVYAVKQVSALTGVSEATLRVWERRYKVVAPARSAGGYRLYDDDQVATLRAMAALVHDGVPASIAARTIQGSEVRGEGSEVRAEGSANGEGASFDLVAAAALLDPGLVHAVLTDAFAASSFDDVVDEWLPSELQRLGEAWQTGRLTVAQEHFASAAVTRQLSTRFEEAQPRGGAPVLVGLPQGGRHEVMLLAFAVCLRRAGVNTIYLGADVPLDDWTTVASEVGARAAVLGVHLEEDVVPAQSVVDRLAALRPPVPVRVGGRNRHRIAGARPLDERVSQAAVAMARDLRAGAL